VCEEGRARRGKPASIFEKEEKRHERSVNGTGTVEFIEKFFHCDLACGDGVGLADLRVWLGEVGGVVISATVVAPANSIGKESSRKGKQPSSSSCGKPTSGSSLPQPSRDLK
jgi:hypothetical protein